MDQRIRIIIAGDNQHEELFAEIDVDDEYVGQLSQDEGMKNLKFELPTFDMVEDWVAKKVDLQEFRRALDLAEKRIVLGS